MSSLVRQGFSRCVWIVVFLLTLVGIAHGQNVAEERIDEAAVGQAGHSVSRTVSPCPPAEDSESSVRPQPEVRMRRLAPSPGDWGPLRDLVFMKDRGGFRLEIRNGAEPLNADEDPCSEANRAAGAMRVFVLVGYPTSDRVHVPGFVDGLYSHRFSLLPGQKKTIESRVKPLLEQPQLQFYETDGLFGVRVWLRAFPADSDELVLDENFYVYRYLDACDDKHQDEEIELADTLVDGADGAVRERIVGLGMHESAQCELGVENAGAFGTREEGGVCFITFDPTELGEQNTGLTIRPSDRDQPIASFKLFAKGTPKNKIYFNLNGFVSILNQLQTVHPRGEPLAGQVFPQLLTASEVALFDEPDEKNALAQHIEEASFELFREAGVEAGVEFVHSRDDKENEVFIRWARRTSTGFLGVTSGGTDGSGEVSELLATWEEYTRGELYFRLAQALNQTRKERIQLHIDNCFEHSRGGAPLQLTHRNPEGPRNEDHGIEGLVNGAAKTLVHEAGHSFGLVHSAQIENAPGWERQQLIVTATTAGEMPTYQLSFVDDNLWTDPIPIGATDVEIEQALSSLLTIGSNGKAREKAILEGNKLFKKLPLVERPNVLVRQYPPGDPKVGPFTIDFGGYFAGCDVPQIKVKPGGVVYVKTLWDGEGGTVLKQEPAVDGSGKFPLLTSVLSLPDSEALAQSDIMLGGFLDWEGKLRFQPGISKEQLLLALDLAYTNDDAERVFEYRMWNDQVAANIGKALFDTSDPESYERLFRRKRKGRKKSALRLLGPDRRVVDRVIELGEIDSAQGAAQASLLVTNLGREVLKLEEVRLAGDAPIAVTVVPPRTKVKLGTPLELTLTVVPEKFRGPFESRLVIRSSDRLGYRSIAVRGTIVGPEPALRVEVSNNNFGGVAVGATSRRPALVVLRNVGGAELEVQGAEAATVVGAKFGLEGFSCSPAEPARIPVGGTLELTVTCSPERPGLVAGLLRLKTNDPHQRQVEQRLVATGIPAEGSAFGWGGEYVAAEQQDADQLRIVRALSDANGSFDLGLLPAKRYRMVYFDPQSGLVAHDTGVSSVNGEPTLLTFPEFRASREPDRDGDFLPDDVEFALGTDPENRDSNGDGTSDFDALRAGADPLGAGAVRGNGLKKE